MYSFCTHVDEVLGAAGGNPRGQSRSFELVLHYISGSIHCGEHVNVFDVGLLFFIFELVE